MKTLAIIGSTGSIGKSSLDIYEDYKKNFDLVYLAANTNKKKLELQFLKYKPQKYFLLKNNKSYQFTKRFVSLEEALKEKQRKIDFVISGISGYESLDINFKLLKISKNLLIANKETIICGGKIFLQHAKKYNCNIIPIDSEHFCINYFLKNFKFKKNFIEKFYLVASGGPFFKKKIKFNEKIKNVLKHPNWKMGKKITIDSSNFANKVLELFEAKILFNIKPSKIKIIVEQTSNAHAVIKLKNNIYLPILHFPSMKISISSALNLICRKDIIFNRLNISFQDPNLRKFPIITLGYKILIKYGFAGMIIFTVLNERLVKMYLNGEIKYGEISKILVKTFRKKFIIKKSNYLIRNKSNIFDLIKWAQNLKIT